MCLRTVVSYDSESFPEKKTAYKIMIKSTFPNFLCFPFRSISCKQVTINREYDKTSVLENGDNTYLKTIQSEFGSYYGLGFHSFSNKKDAITRAKLLIETKAQSFVTRTITVIKCEISEITCVGTECINLPATSDEEPKVAKVYVSNKVVFKEIVWSEQVL